MSLCDENEAAAILDCSVHKLRRDRRIGSPIPYVKIGRSVRYLREDLGAYISERSFRSTSQYTGGGNV